MILKTQRLPISVKTACKQLDGVFVLLILSLLCLGLIMISSASSEIASVRYGSTWYFTLRQVLYTVAGLIFAVCVLLIPMRLWQKIGFWMAPIGLVLLMSVLIVGREVNGSVRWIHLGLINIQVSEVAKLALVIYLASYLVRHRESALHTWTGFMKPLLVLAVAMVLLLLEPDFGATVVLSCAFIGVLFLAGLPWVRFTLLVCGAALSLGLIAISQPYRLHRLATYMNPWQYQFDSGYQLTQSLIAFGRGSWWGAGLGNGIQKLFYLPEAHTDFIFAVAAEELGLLGSLVILLLLFCVVWRALRIGQYAKQSQQWFGSYLAYGIALLFGGQICINLGVNTGLLPTKGLALPFLSYGGSSLLMNCIAVALLLRIDYERRMQMLVKDHHA